SLPGLVLDTDYNPGTGLNSIINLNGGYGAVLQLAVPTFSTALNMAQIGDGNFFLGGHLNGVTVEYTAPTLGVGAGNTYRLGGNNGSALALSGADNVLTGTARVIIGSQLSNLGGGAITNGAGTVTIRNSNNYSGGTSISKGSTLSLEVAASSGTPLGSGTVEVYGTIQAVAPTSGISGSSSFYNAITNANNNTLVLRPGGSIIINDQLGLEPGAQGRWRDTTGQDLNGGTFRFNGVASAQSAETIGTINVSKGGTLTIARAAGAGSATLVTGGLTRNTHSAASVALTGMATTAASQTITVSSTAGLTVGMIITGTNIPAGSFITSVGVGTFTINQPATATGSGLTASTTANTGNGTLLITASAVINGALGAATSQLGVINQASAVPTTSYDRLLVTGGVAIAGTTALGANAVNSGIAPVWIVDSQNHTYLTYNPTAIDAGFQSLVTGTTLGDRQVGYSDVITAGSIGALGAGKVVDVNTAAATLAANATLYALRSNQNISPTASFNTITFNSGAGNIGGGLLLTGGIINPVQAASTTVTPVTRAMTLAFGGNEALIYAGATSVINAQITGSNGLTKFGASQLTISSSNGGLTGPISVNQGTLFLQNPVSNSGSAIASATNSQNIYLNGAAGQGSVLTIDSLISNDAGTDSNIASGVRVTGNIGSNVFVNADAVINNNNQGIMQRINNLTIADLGADSPIYLTFSQNGITVTGTTTLGANSNVINSAFGVANQSILEGQVVGGASGKLIKAGNGGLMFANGTNSFGTAGQTGLEVWASTQNTATSLIGSTTLTGTPFGAGDINLLPGTLIRLAAAGNIANQKVTATSDAMGFSGVSFGYNNNNGTPLTQADILSVLTTTGATNGKVQLNSTGPALGVISLDNGVQYGALDLGAMETALGGGGKLWLGTSMSGAINQLYFAPTLGASTDNVYRFGAGGNQGTMQIGAGAFENVLTGNTSVQIGAVVGGGNGNNNLAVINGNFNLTLNTRNDYTGDTYANRGSTLNIGNNFALGSGKLIVNHTSNTGTNIGQGNEGAVSAGGISLLNTVDLVGDFRTGGTNFVLRGLVNLAPNVSGGTRTIETTAEMSILGVITGAGANLIKTGAGNLILHGMNTYTGTTTLNGAGGLFVGADVLANTAGPLGNSDSALLISTTSTLGLSGQVVFGRDILISAASTILGNSLYTSRITGGVGLTAGVTLLSLSTGRIEMLGPIAGASAVTIGSTATAAPLNNGVVYIGAG
ncbi:MAG: hypothetical protein B7Z52_00370, partial [Burkholderiales bacterium 12-64-5]